MNWRNKRFQSHHPLYSTAWPNFRAMCAQKQMVCFTIFIFITNCCYIYFFSLRLMNIKKTFRLLTHFYCITLVNLRFSLSTDSFHLMLDISPRLCATNLMRIVDAVQIKYVLPSPFIRGFKWECMDRVRFAMEPTNNWIDIGYCVRRSIHMYSIYCVTQTSNFVP